MNTTLQTFFNLSRTKKVFIRCLLTCGLMSLYGCASEGGEASDKHPVNSSSTTTQLATTEKPYTTTTSVTKNGATQDSPAGYTETVTKMHDATATKPGYTTTTTTSTGAK